MEQRKSLEQLSRILSDIGNEKCSYYFNPLLCSQLKSIILPANPTQCLNYLIKERQLLIEILSDYQIQYKVIIFSFIVSNAKA